jgi:hypothetical protein
MSQQARSASAIYDPASGRVRLDVTLSDGETISIDLLCPELLADSLQRALQRKREINAKPDAGKWRLAPLTEN